MLHNETPSLFYLLKRMILKKGFHDEETIRFIYNEKTDNIKKYLHFNYDSNDDIAHILKSYEDKPTPLSEKEYQDLLSLLHTQQKEQRKNIIKKNITIKNDFPYNSSHPLYIGSKIDKKDEWIVKKKIENDSDNFAQIEVLAQEWDISIRDPERKSKLKTRLAVDDTNEFFLMSKKIHLTTLRSIDKHQFLKDIKEEKITGLGSASITAIYTDDNDRNTENIVLSLNNSFITHLDLGEHSFANHAISASILRQLPFLPHDGLSHAYNWFDLNNKDIRDVKKSYVIPEMADYPRIIHEKYNTIMRLLTRPNYLTHHFIRSYIKENTYDVTNLFIQRNKQLQHAALQIQAFNNYILDDQSHKELQEYISSLETFKTTGQHFLLRSKEQDKRLINEEFNDLKKSAFLIQQILSHKKNSLDLDTFLLKHKSELDALSWPPLYAAAETNDIELINACLRAKPIIDIENVSSTTPLQLAAMNGHLEAMQLLIENQSMIHLEKHDGTILYFLAAIHSPLPLFQLLLNKEKKFRKIDYSKILSVAIHKGFNESVQRICDEKKITFKDGGKKQLYKAIKSNNFKIIKILCEYKANTNTFLTDTASAFHMAVLQGNENLVTHLLEAKADVNLLDKEDNSPLLHAVLAKNRNIVKTLCMANAEINYINKKNGDMALYNAICLGELPLVNILCESKADVNLHYSSHCSGLYLAAQEGHLQIAKTLCEYKASVDELYKGYSPLHKAADLGNEPLIHLLLQFKANVNLSSPFGTALRIAAQNNHPSIVRKLRIPQAITASSEAWLSLVAAIANKNEEIVNILCQTYSGIINIPDEENESLLLIVVKHVFNLPIIRCLLKHGASIRSKNKEGQGFYDLLNEKLIQFATAENFLAIKMLLNEYKELHLTTPDSKGKTADNILFHHLLKHAKDHTLSPIENCHEELPDIFHTFLDKKDDSGKNMLLYAAESMNDQSPPDHSLPLYLLDAKASVDVENPSGQNFLSIMKEKAIKHFNQGDFGKFYFFSETYPQLDLNEDSLEKALFNKLIKQDKCYDFDLLDKIKLYFPHTFHSLVNKQDHRTALLFAATEGDIFSIKWLLDNRVQTEFKNDQSKQFSDCLNKGILKLNHSLKTTVSAKKWETLYELKCNYFLDKEKNEVTLVEDTLFSIFLEKIKSRDMNWLKPLEHFKPLLKKLSTIKDFKDNTAVSWAANLGYIDLLKWLFANGASPPTTNEHGYTFIDNLNCGLIACANRLDFIEIDTIQREYKTTNLKLTVDNETAESVLISHSKTLIGPQIGIWENFKLYDQKLKKLGELTKYFPNLLFKIMNDETYHSRFFHRLIINMVTDIAPQNQFMYFACMLALQEWEIEKFKSVLLSRELSSNNVLHKNMKICIEISQHFASLSLNTDITSARTSAIKALFLKFTQSKEWRTEFTLHLTFFKELDKAILNFSKKIPQKLLTSTISPIYKKYAEKIPDERAIKDHFLLQVKKESSLYRYPLSLRFWKAHDQKEYQEMIDCKEKLSKINYIF